MKLREHVHLEMAIKLIRGELKLVDSYSSIKDELGKITVSEYFGAEHLCQRTASILFSSSFSFLASRSTCCRSLRSHLCHTTLLVSPQDLSSSMAFIAFSSLLDRVMILAALCLSRWEVIAKPSPELAPVTTKTCIKCERESCWLWPMRRDLILEVWNIFIQVEGIPPQQIHVDEQR
jgi:hypothetical protein